MLPKMLSVDEIRRRRIQVASRQATETGELANTSLDEIHHLDFARRQKELLEKEIEERENRRKMSLEEDLRHAAQIRKERAEREQREEEERRRMIEERRLADRERRQRHAQRQREWMEQLYRDAEAEKRKRLEAQQHVKDERRTRPLPLKPRSPVDKTVDVGFEGWVTVQSRGTAIWKRRFCRVEFGTFVLLRDNTRVCSHQLGLPVPGSDLYAAITGH